MAEMVENHILVPKRITHVRLVGGQVHTSPDEYTSTTEPIALLSATEDPLEYTRIYWTKHELARQRYYEVVQRYP